MALRVSTTPVRTLAFEAKVRPFSGFIIEPGPFSPILYLLWIPWSAPVFQLPTCFL